MQYVKSCGAVVFTRRKNEVLFVIIRHHNGDCGFPKGHVEPGETEQQTALREIREEIGLNVRILEGFRQDTSYLFPNRPDKMKQAVYFLAEFEHQEIITQREEVKDAYLVPYERALELLTFKETKDILTEVNRFLIEKGTDCHTSVRTGSQ